MILKIKYNFKNCWPPNAFTTVTAGGAGMLHCSRPTLAEAGWSFTTTVNWYAGSDMSLVCVNFQPEPSYHHHAQYFYACADLLLCCFASAWFRLENRPIDEHAFLYRVNCLELPELPHVPLLFHPSLRFLQIFFAKLLCRLSLATLGYSQFAPFLTVRSLIIFDNHAKKSTRTSWSPVNQKMQ